MVKQGITIYGIVVGQEFPNPFKILVIADIPPEHYVSEHVSLCKLSHNKGKIKPWCTNVILM